MVNDHAGAMLYAVLAVLVIAALVGGAVVALRARRRRPGASTGPGRRNAGHDRSP